MMVGLFLFVRIGFNKLYRNLPLGLFLKSHVHLNNPCHESVFRKTVVPCQGCRILIGRAIKKKTGENIKVLSFTGCNQMQNYESLV